MIGAVAGKTISPPPITGKVPRTMSEKKMPLKLKTGGLLLEVQFRRSRGDSGLTFDVFSEISGKKERLLRFDCFKDGPHYHLGRIRVNPIDKSEVLDVPRWVLEQLKTRLLPLIEEAGYPKVAEGVDPEAVAASLNKNEREIFQLLEENRQ